MYSSSGGGVGSLFSCSSSALGIRLVASRRMKASCKVYMVDIQLEEFRSQVSGRRSIRHGFVSTLRRGGLRGVTLVPSRIAPSLVITAALLYIPNTSVMRES